MESTLITLATMHEQSGTTDIGPEGRGLAAEFSGESEGDAVPQRMIDLLQSLDH